MAEAAPVFFRETPVAPVAVNDATAVSIVLVESTLPADAVRFAVCARMSASEALPSRMLCEALMVTVALLPVPAPRADSTPFNVTSSSFPPPLSPAVTEMFAALPLVVPPSAVTAATVTSPSKVAMVTTPPASLPPAAAVVLIAPANEILPAAVTSRLTAPESEPDALGAVSIKLPALSDVMPEEALRTTSPAEPPSVLRSALAPDNKSEPLLVRISIPSTSVVTAWLSVIFPVASTSNSFAVHASLVATVPVLVSFAIPEPDVSLTLALPVLLMVRPVSPSAVNVVTSVSSVVAAAMSPSLAWSTAIPAWMSGSVLLASTML